MVVCLPCLAVPAAIIAAGGAGAAASTPEEQKKKRMYLIVYWVSISLLVASILVLVYFVFIKKDVCKSCIAG